MTRKTEDSPLTSSIRRRRRALVSFSALALATGAAFATGTRLRAQFPAQTRVAPSRPTQVAQAAPPDTLDESRIAASSEAGGPGGQKASGDVEAVGQEQYRTFYQVYDLVKRNYVDKLPSDTAMSHGAIKGMLASLKDPNSFFIEPNDRRTFDQEADGTFAGIGAALFTRAQKRDGYTEYKIVVVGALPGSPAQKAGLKSGDVITHVDSRWVLGVDPGVAVNKALKRVQARDADEDELVKAVEAAQARIKGGIGLMAAQLKLRSGVGEPRTVTIQRPGAREPMTLAMTTAETRVTPVVAKTLPGGIAYIKVNVFSEATFPAFKTALAALPKQPGLVLDLRNNPGGLLDPARNIAGALTRGGNFAFEIGPGNKRTPLLATPSAFHATRPVIVLVDGGTASTAEALAASLKDKQVGTLVGGKTFGDAAAQTFYPLPDESAFLLTTGKLVGPSGTDWQGAGLSPGVALRGDTPEERVIARAVSVLKSRAARQVAARLSGS